MDQWEHPLAKFILGRHEDALAVEEELGVPAPRSREALALCWAASLSVEVAARMSSMRLKDGPEMAWSAAASSEQDSLSRRERASAAELRCPRQYSTAKSKPNSLLSHWCCGIVHSR